MAMKLIYSISYLCILFFSTLVKAELIAFEQEGQWGYQNEKNQTVISPQFMMANDFTQGIASVVDEQGWAFINATGQVVIRPFIFDNGPDYFVDGLARFVEHGKMGFFNEQYKIVIAAQFDFVEPFTDGLAAFCMDCQLVKSDDEHRMIQGGKWGYIDKTGHIVVKANFASESALEKQRTP